MDNQNIPDYINTFISHNFEKLSKIYDNHLKDIPDEDKEYSMLSFKCKQSENKMDVRFMVKQDILNNFNQEDWKRIVDNNMNKKKIFFIDDLDKQEHYLLYV